MHITKEGFEMLQFPVHMDAKCLKDPGKGFDRVAPDGGLHRGCKLACGDRPPVFFISLAITLDLPSSPNL